MGVVGVVNVCGRTGREEGGSRMELNNINGD